MTTDRINRPLEDIDRYSQLHPFTQIIDLIRTGPVIMKRGLGVRVWDTRGREYIDGAAGLWCVNVGHGREEIAEAIARQARELAFFHGFSMANEPCILLASEILDQAPGNMQRVFFGTSGSDANDTNVKLVWYYNNLRGLRKKKKIISRRRGYHGVTVAAGSLSGLNAVHNWFDLPLPQVVHTSEPDCYRHANRPNLEPNYSRRLASELEKLIIAEGPETVAAFVAEPVMGTGGVLLPPAEYFKEIKLVLDKYDILLILDEVISGFGRLGTWFGADKFSVESDLISFAKGVTSGYVPLSGSIIGQRLWSVLEETSHDVGVFGHGFTYSGHPVATAAGLANLHILKTDNLLTRAERSGQLLLQELRSSCRSNPLVGDIRGAGLMVGVELVQDRNSKLSFDPTLRVAARVARKSAEKGALVRGLPTCDVIAFSPPFIITEGEISELVDRFSHALHEVADDLIREGTVLH